MTINVSQQALTNVLLWTPRTKDPLFRAIAQRLGQLRKEINSRRENRARAVVATRELSSMSDRELHDLGIDRGDISRVTRAANFVR